MSNVFSWETDWFFHRRRKVLLTTLYFLAVARILDLFCNFRSTIANFIEMKLRELFMIKIKREIFENSNKFDVSQRYSLAMKNSASAENMKRDELIRCAITQRKKYVIKSMLLRCVLEADNETRQQVVIQERLRFEKISN